MITYRLSLTNNNYLRCSSSTEPVIIGDCEYVVSGMQKSAIMIGLSFFGPFLLIVVYDFKEILINSLKLR